MKNLFGFGGGANFDGLLLVEVNINNSGGWSGRRAAAGWWHKFSGL